MVEIKTDGEIAKLRELGRIAAVILKKLAGEIRAGVKAKDLDEMAERLTTKQAAVPAFKGYHGYPASLCVSVNDVVVHGIPGDRPFENGDLVSLDFGIVKDGYYSDIAVTVPVGDISPEDRHLLDVTREALDRGIEQARVGNRLQDISYAIQRHVEKNRYSVVRKFVGHGIGRALHEEPQVPNYGQPGCGMKLKEGMVLAIEPMVNAGKYDVKVDRDGWTARTADGSKSAHFEHCVAITKGGPVVLTGTGEADA